MRDLAVTSDRRRAARSCERTSVFHATTPPTTAHRGLTRLHRAATIVAFVLAALASAANVSAAGERPRAIGSSAGELGVSGAIADFNADGQPDVAVADRVVSHGNADYELSVQIANGATQIVRFRSAQYLLAVTAVDIDHDDDIDLVFTPVLGHGIERVWLNDGHGHFSASTAASQPSQTPQFRSSVVLRLPSSGVALFPRSTADAFVDDARGGIADTLRRLFPEIPSPLLAFQGSSLALRGPPPLIGPATV